MIIGVLRLIVELGRADITMEASGLASMMEYPHEGYIKEVFCVFDFIKGKQNILVVFDPIKPVIDLSKLSREYWS